MKNSFESTLEKFNYQLPEELIAQEPATPRDAAKLLVYDRKTKKMVIDTFKHIGKYLPSNSVLVLNQTKVVPARLHVTKETGGRAEILFISRDNKTIKVIADRRLTVGSKLWIDKKLHFTILEQQENFYILEPSFARNKFTSVLMKFGHTPLPPYIKHSRLTESRRRKEYQTVFAGKGESVAAPTASLHFTKPLLRQLQQQGITLAYVQLTVGLGTFASLKPENLETKKLHTEHYEIPVRTARLLEKAKQQGRPIVAVGTTVVRTLESAVVHGKLQHLTGDTSLFITEDYELQFVDNLITNFHVPKSSLLMLVSALTGRKKLMDLYSRAIGERFRFFSFGDGMLIL